MSDLGHARLARLAGRIVIAPGTAAPVRCERPIASSGLLGRLLHARPVHAVAPLVGAVLTLCSEVHQLTARRALAAASGVQPCPAEQAVEQAWLAARTLRDHLVQLGLGLSAIAPSDTTADDQRWLRGLPAAPPLPNESSASDSRSQLKEMVRFAQRALLGMDLSRWIRRFGEPSIASVSAWTRDTARSHPAGRWLAQAMHKSRGVSLELRPLQPKDAPAFVALGQAVKPGPDQAAAASLCGAPAETGAFCRIAGPEVPAGAHSAWDVLAGRLVDILELCRSETRLSLGALSLGDGESIAYSEMARGLLVHWVKLAPSPQADARTVQDYRLLAPTDWNFHPQGALARYLHEHGSDEPTARLLVAALDPCAEVHFEHGEVWHA